MMKYSRIKKGKLMKNKSTDFVTGLVFGILICFTIWACTGTTAIADSWVAGEVRWKPLYVVVVEE